jgi:hypothetical protein
MYPLYRKNLGAFISGVHQIYDETLRQEFVTDLRGPTKPANYTKKKDYIATGKKNFF